MHLMRQLPPRRQSAARQLRRDQIRRLPRRTRIYLILQTAGEAAALISLVWVLMYGTPMTILGIITTTTSMFVKWTGQPDQVIKLFRGKTSVHMSYVYHGLATISYVSWTIYGIRSHDLTLVLGQILGSPGSLAMFHLIVRYRIIERISATGEDLVLHPWSHGFVYGNNHEPFHLQMYASGNDNVVGIPTDMMRPDRPTHITRIARVGDRIVVDVEGPGDELLYWCLQEDGVVIPMIYMPPT